MNTATIRARATTVALVLCITSFGSSLRPATAQTVAEIGNAGELPVSAQQETEKAITLITGALSSNADIDMFKITIDDPSAFSATTAGPTGPGTVNDTRLFLLDASGYPVYFNDDLPSGATLRSLLPAGHALSPSTPTDYYLAIAGYPKHPTDGTTNIFSEPDFDPGFAYTDIIGPNPSTSNPISVWAGGNANTGTYEIALTGVNGTLPVEIVGVRVVVDDGGATLRWSTQSELRNAGFDVELRTSEDLTFRTVGYVAGTGEPSDYSFRVDGLEPGQYAIRIRQVDTDGSSTYSNQVDVAVELTSTHFVSTPYPNPFNESTTLNLTVREDQHVQVNVFDMTGRRVATLSDAILPAHTTHRFEFRSEGLPSGVYVIRATGERFRANSLVTLVR